MLYPGNYAMHCTNFKSYTANFAKKWKWRLVLTMWIIKRNWYIKKKRSIFNIVVLVMIVRKETKWHQFSLSPKCPCDSWYISTKSNVFWKKTSSISYTELSLQSVSSNLRCHRQEQFHMWDSRDLCQAVSVPRREVMTVDFISLPWLPIIQT